MPNKGEMIKQRGTTPLKNAALPSFAENKSDNNNNNCEPLAVMITMKSEPRNLERMYIHKICLKQSAMPVYTGSFGPGFTCSRVLITSGGVATVAAITPENVLVKTRFAEYSKNLPAIVLERKILDMGICPLASVKFRFNLP